MQNYASYAEQIVEQLDSGELAPEEVDIRPFLEDDTVFTPALRDRLEGTGKVVEYNERFRERTQADLAERQREKESEHNEAIRALRDPTQKGTGSVTLNNVEFTVKNYLNGRMERKMLNAEAAEQRGESDLSMAREALVDLALWLVVDARWVGDTEPPEGFNDWSEAEFWRDYAEDFGVGELRDTVLRLGQPYRERQEEIDQAQSFRGDE